MNGVRRGTPNLKSRNTARKTAIVTRLDRNSVKERIAITAVTATTREQKFSTSSPLVRANLPMQSG